MGFWKLFCPGECDLICVRCWALLIIAFGWTASESLLLTVSKLHNKSDAGTLTFLDYLGLVQFGEWRHRSLLWVHLCNAKALNMLWGCPGSVVRKRDLSFSFAVASAVVSLLAQGHGVRWVSHVPFDLLPMKLLLSEVIWTLLLLA
jgi:hypothetical protein